MISTKTGSDGRMSNGGRRKRAVRALGAGLLASVLIHAAVLLLPPFQVETPERFAPPARLTIVPPPEEPPPEVDVPSAPRPIPSPAEPRLATGGEPVPADEGGPRFVPHDVPPKLLNPGDVQQYLRIFYPMALRVASVEGAVHLWLYVNESGEATKLQIRESSGSEKFDGLARSAAPLMRFRPALNQGERVGVWVSLWVRFNLEDVPTGEAESQIAGGVGGG